ncbi:transposase [Rhodococcus sp. IEGM 1379]|uniref:IS110 family transposase n=1 Tax=Rhodococcus sp. IEGM 1379 TaxID=3047086 RepID=UPI0024B7E668|nr:transposase [Rhodococcus sp. IEGM 1379]MDI9918714.1 transposase [Rhodococcus sp. IEGM 1379]
MIDAGIAVFVVPSRQIKALRTRYGSAGNKDDRRGAYVLADTLRTDGHRWRPLREDHPESKALRAMCRARKDLVETRVQVMNQLRSNLELAFPGALGLFSRLDSEDHVGLPSPVSERSQSCVALSGTSGPVAAIGRLQRRYLRGVAVPARRQCGPRALLQSRQRLAVRSRPVWSPPSKR